MKSRLGGEKRRSAEGDAQASRLSSFRQDAATGAYAVAARRTGAGATFKLDRSASSLQAPRGDWAGGSRAESWLPNRQRGARARRRRAVGGIEHRRNRRGAMEALRGRLTRTGQAGSVPPGKRTSCLGVADGRDGWSGGVGVVGSVRGSDYIKMYDVMSDGEERHQMDARSGGRSGDVQPRVGGNGKSGAESGSLQPLQPHLPQ
jgi:hypothetical protein